MAVATVGTAFATAAATAPPSAPQAEEELPTPTEEPSTSSDPKLNNYRIAYRASLNSAQVLVDTLDGDMAQSIALNVRAESIGAGFAFSARSFSDGMVGSTIWGTNLATKDELQLTTPPSPGLADTDALGNYAPGVEVYYGDSSPVYAKGIGRLYFARTTYEHNALTPNGGSNSVASEIYRVEIINGKPQMEEAVDTNVSLSSPVGLTVDSSGSVLATKCRRGEAGNFEDLCVIHLDSGVVDRLQVPNARYNDVPQIDPDGKRLVVSAQSTIGNGHSGIYLYDLESKAWERLVELPTMMGSTPSWAPTKDSDYVVFSNVYRMDRQDPIYVIRLSDRQLLKSALIGSQPIFLE